MKKIEKKKYFGKIISRGEVGNFDRRANGSYLLY